MPNDWEEQLNGLKQGSIRSMARLITWVENRRPGWMDAMKTIYRNNNQAHVIGITGSPGAGKSTLTGKLTSDLVDKGYSVGVIAVDPSSPFTGGALLGDRLRMKAISTMEGVFVRSMATRGALGGLSLAARDVVKIMDAFGKDIVIIETVGVGQDEVEVVRTADLVIVVCVPGQGDGIQAIKAGIMEIADLFVVNKADREGADQVVVDIQTMLSLGSQDDDAKIPVLKTVSTTGQGLPELVETISEFFTDAEKDAEKTPKKIENRIREELLVLLEKETARALRRNWVDKGLLDKAVENIISGERDPYSIVQEVIKTSLIN